jgi:hypothetical protein
MREYTQEEIEAEAREVQWGGYQANGYAKSEAQTEQPASTEEWPVMAEDAYHGLAGEVVSTIGPHSESDPVAVLVQFLVASGNLIGTRAYYQVERDRHHANLFAVLVGASSKGRKGTSWGWVKDICKVGFKEWTDDKVKGGLSSGEGLINEVRDAVSKWNAKEGLWEEVDPGVPDKRLLLIEAEFAACLSVMERHGNTISPLIRRAWDGDKLSTMTRNSPLTATGAHVSIIGHCTDTELKARLTRTEAANGFANRFLFPLVTRSKELPFGGALTDSQVLHLGESLAKIVNRLPQEPTRVTMTGAARAIWAAIYSDLSAGKPGLLGAVTARAEAQTIRLATLYALLDGKTQIDDCHLNAGLAVWEYCEASAAHVFGGALGDPVADEILTALRSSNDGMNRTTISGLFGRNQSSDRIGAALTTLLNNGLASYKIETLPKGGRLETWFAQ